MAEPMSADQHERQLAARGWPGVKQLAERWGISRALVRAIPRDRLPYLAFGQSIVRRYDPMDVAEYEAREKTGAAA